MIEKIISGGQTGADQGALDIAIELGIPHGGWIPPPAADAGEDASAAQSALAQASPCLRRPARRYAEGHR